MCRLAYISQIHLNKGNDVLQPPSKSENITLFSIPVDQQYHFSFMTSEWHMQPLLHLNVVTHWSLLSAVNDQEKQTVPVLFFLQ